MFPLSLVKIDRIVKKWQLCFEIVEAARIQDGGDSHLEFLKLCIPDVIDIFQIEVPMFSQILATIGPIVDKLHQFFEIQNGDSHHLEKYNFC